MRSQNERKTPEYGITKQNMEEVYNRHMRV